MARKRRKKEPKPSVEEIAAETKEDTISWPGGLNLDLARKMESEKTLEDELSAHISEVLEQEMKNQEERLANIPKWNEQYRGFRKERNFPFDKSANTAPPLTRSAADTVYVRLEDTLYGKKIFLIKPNMEGIADLTFKIEESLQWFMDLFFSC